MGAITDSQFYTDQVGTAGDTVVKTYPKAGTDTEFPPIVRNLDATESAADTFNLVRLKEGQVLRADLSTVTHDDGGTTLTIDIGDSVDPDRYSDGFDIGGGAGTERFTTPAIPDSVPNPFSITEATRDIIVTIKTTGTPAAADVVYNLVIEQGSNNRGPTT